MRGIAGRNVRLMLPADIFLNAAEPVKVAFHPTQGTMTVVSTPEIAREAEPTTGSHLRRPRGRVREVVEKAWSNAVARVPKPDAARLGGGEAIELALDVDMTLEGGSGASDKLPEKESLHAFEYSEVLHDYYVPHKSGPGGP